MSIEASGNHNASFSLRNYFNMYTDTFNDGSNLDHINSGKNEIAELDHNVEEYIQGINQSQIDVDLSNNKPNKNNSSVSKSI